MAGTYDRFDDRQDDLVRERERARSAVMGPATLLILVGAMNLIFVVLFLLSRPQWAEGSDKVIDQIKANPNLNRDEKNEQIDAVEKTKELVDNPFSLFYALAVLGCSLLMILGGVRMLHLSGPALPSISAVLAMAPFTACFCCLLGFPAGVWALVVLFRPDVRAAMARQANPSQSMDDTEID